MELQVASQVLVLFILMAAGFISYRFKITTKEGAAYFSAFVMKITLPCMVYQSFLRPFSRELLGEAGATLAVAFLVYGLALLYSLAYPYIFKIRGPERGIHRYAIFIPNSGLFGFPVISAIIGPSYIFHAAIFSVPANFLAFSVGLWLVAKEGGKAPAFSWKTFTSPLLLATIAGFITFIFEIGVPGPLEQSIRLAGNASTPIAMAVIGISIAQASAKQIFGRWRVYVTVIMRLLVIPALVGLACFLAGIRGPLLMLPVIICAMPAGSTTSIFASVYDVAIEEAGSIVALSTLMCAVTIPIVAITIHYFAN
jgi:predicted permease